VRSMGRNQVNRWVWGVVAGEAPGIACSLALCLVVFGLMACLPAAVFAWQEPDFVHRRVVTYPFTPPQGSGDLQAQTIIGTPRDYIFQEKDTILDIARYFDLGYNELHEAYPGVDPWIPPKGRTMTAPTFWVLPSPPYQGVVINIPEMRLYYFPSSTRGLSQQAVITFPVGLGREEWPTPQVEFRVRGKTVNPTWVIPESIKKERIEEKGWTENFIPGGHPDNPLGAYRIELTLPIRGSYAIHGTNNPWAVGRLVTHGCIRLYPEDIKQFFSMIRPGTKGEFIYEPVKVGVLDGKVYVEVHKDIYSFIPDLRDEARRVLEEAGLGSLVDTRLLAVALRERSGVPVNVTRRERRRTGLASQEGQGSKKVMLE